MTVVKIKSTLLENFIPLTCGEMLISIMYKDVSFFDNVELCICFVVDEIVDKIIADCVPLLIFHLYEIRCPLLRLWFVEIEI